VATTLETDRLVLRPFTRDDLDELVPLHAEPSFWHYPLRRGQSADETAAFIERAVRDYESGEVGLEAVVERRSGALAGWAGLSVPSFLPEILPATEVGWRLGSAWRGRGFATEAGAAWVRWGFESLGLERILSIYEPANKPSGRVVEKLGFVLDRTAVVPASGDEVHVTALELERWLELCDGDGWPRRPASPG
jgi:RimJ/RimL family protein N-acetyltransferase